MEQKTKRRKTKWSLYEWQIGDTKQMARHELANFRSSLSVWNNTEGNERIDYTHTVNEAKSTVTVTRIS